MTLFLIFITMLCFSSPVYAGSTDEAQEQELTPEQQNELAKQVGVVLIGMTKNDVREIFGLLELEIWYTPEGQEVWYFKIPGSHNIYFKGDEVEKVEHGPKPKIKQPVEM